MKAWRNKKAKQKTFHIGDLVLVGSSHTESLAKLQPKWNGPYVISEKSRPGSYGLLDFEGRNLHVQDDL
jgi:hypothetical protein